MKYKTILADPPWQYKTKNRFPSYNGTGGSEAHYSTMSLDEIKNLSIIEKIADKDCMLFLWSTIPMFPDAFQVLEAWGFQYISCIIWVKTKIFPMGFWWRVYVEICLIAKRGNVKPFRQNTPNIFFAPVTKHSRKPERFFQMIDSIIPRPAIELFAREKREGWDSWGDEIE